MNPLGGLGKTNEAVNSGDGRRGGFITLRMPYPRMAQIGSSGIPIPVTSLKYFTAQVGIAVS